MYTWQKGVVLDNADRLYQKFLTYQAASHVLSLDNFRGIVVDRSDWMDYYNLDGDDGISFVNGSVASSLRVSYRNTMSRVVQMMAEASNQKQTPPPVALINTLGNARLDVMGPYDGSFSEGSVPEGLNRVGLLGVASPTILWVNGHADCCDTDAAAHTFFQRHLYMGVYPVAPFPNNDHCIQPNATVEAHYLAYGPLFNEVIGGGKEWVLLDHPVVKTSPLAATNTFSLPRRNQTLIFAIMAVQDPAATSITVQLRSCLFTHTRCAMTPGNKPTRPHARVPFAVVAPDTAVSMVQGHLSDDVVQVTVPLTSARCFLLRYTPAE